MHKHKLTRVATVVLATILLILVIPSTVGAGGLAVAPSTIKIDYALRGAVYEQMLRVYNVDEAAATFQVRANGDVGEWISFNDPESGNTPLETITIAAEQRANVLVKIHIPDDAPVGTSTGAIYTETITSEEVQGNPVVLGAKVNVTIDVAGTPVLAGIASQINARDVEVGYPFRVGVRFQNTGNVVAMPHVNLQITRDDTSIDSLTFNEMDIGVKPGEKEDLIYEWDTTGTEADDYVADVTVFLDDEVIATKELNFAILPEGTLTREGVFTELSLNGSPKLGGMARFEISFHNTGLIDTKAQFVGEAYCDGELVASLISDEILIPVAGNDILVSYLKLERPGDYKIKGYINYEGKRTDEKEISFTVLAEEEPMDGVIFTGIEGTETPEPENPVANPGEEGDDNEISTWYLWTAIAVIAVVVLVVGNTFIIRKKRSQSKV